MNARNTSCLKLNDTLFYYKEKAPKNLHLTKLFVSFRKRYISIFISPN
ncbi:hypothetical protein HMPREF9554_01864 [Treponema phagedenis F0421]|nr:hypothetical protein HMPREF9554_01864 [Treponema phagedenis F0421]